MTKLKSLTTFLFYISLISLIQSKSYAQSKDELNNNENQSTLEKSNKINLMGSFFRGTLISNESKNRQIFIPAIFELFPANTVEGFVLNPKISFTQNFNDGKFINIKPNLRYGFGRKKFRAQIIAQYYYSKPQKASLTISGGHFIQQFNDMSTLEAFNNILYTYAFEENYLKIYDQKHLEISHEFAPLKDFMLKANIKWSERSKLNNLESINIENTTYTSNNPTNIELPNSSFINHEAVVLNFKLSWQIDHNYIRSKGKLVSTSPYPMLSVSFSNTLNSGKTGNPSFQKIAFQLSESYNSELVGAGSIHIETGTFLSDDQVYFMDYKHFNGRQTLYGINQTNDFQLLDYYLFSTTNFYIQGHYQHAFKTIQLNAIDKKLHPIIRLNVLHIQEQDLYSELGIGLDNLLNFWKVDLFNSWIGSNHESIGIRFGIKLDHF